MMRSLTSRYELCALIGLNQRQPKGDTTPFLAKGWSRIAPRSVCRKDQKAEIGKIVVKPTTAALVNGKPPLLRYRKRRGGCLCAAYRRSADVNNGLPVRHVIPRGGNTCAARGLTAHHDALTTIRTVVVTQTAANNNPP